MTSCLHLPLADFPSITLEEMGRVKLMNRVDTKYVVSLSTLSLIMHKAQPYYYIQEIDGERMPVYHTTYLDTPDFAMYLAHQNGKLCREKIRVRTYEISGATFLEVKNKNNHGRTRKDRIQVSGRDSLQADGGNAFLHEHAWYKLDNLQMLLDNSFKRITLVNKEMTERLTIDIDLHFFNQLNAQKAALSELAIIELKRAGRVSSHMLDIMHELRINPVGFSKYCMGVALTMPHIKQGRFKPKLRMASKLMHQDVKY